jgi:pyruvate formate lyase activating enzyme
MTERAREELADREQKVVCTICNHSCRLGDGQLGICGVRIARGDHIESLVYGRVVARNVDPIEKKPIFHFLPGTLSYSIATAGCNFRCLHCQNASISQISDVDVAQIVSSGVATSAVDIVSSALTEQCSSISYTYVEPTIFYEFAMDCCIEAKDKGLKNIFVSNGYMSTGILIALAPLLSAINIDLKSFSDSFYGKVCGAKVKPVLENIRHFVELGVWVEVTTLVIPDLNDSNKELSEIANFLYQIDPNIPWHVSGFYPGYKMTSVAPTPPATLQRARQIGIDAGLRYVYTGNRPGSGGENSYCPCCNTEIISRHGFGVTANRLDGEQCPNCKTRIAGVWS